MNPAAAQAYRIHHQQSSSTSHSTPTASDQNVVISFPRLDVASSPPSPSIHRSTHSSFTRHHTRALIDIRSVLQQFVVKATEDLILSGFEVRSLIFV